MSILKDRSFVVLFAFVLCFEVFTNIYYFPVKGDIYTQNLEAIQHLKNAHDSSLGEFLKVLLIKRPDKGTIVPVLELPLIALGISTYFVNKILAVSFALLYFCCLYILFRRRLSGPASAIASLCMGCMGLFFGNLNEAERYLIWLSSLPAAFVFWERSNKRPNHLNSAFFIIFVFLCISSRPFEAFFVALGFTMTYPQVLRSRKVWVAFSLGALWWLCDITAIRNWWSATMDYIDYYVANQKPFYMLRSLLTEVTLLLAVTTLRFQKLNRDSIAILLSGGLMATFLFARGMVVDDYLMSPYLLFLFVLVRAIFSFESSRIVKWRSALMAVLAINFYSDQGVAVYTGRSKWRGSRDMPRMDRTIATGWGQMRGHFSSPSKVALVYYRLFSEDQDIRPTWAALLTLANRDHVDVTFTFPNTHHIEEPTQISELCTRGFTHALIIDPTEEARKSTPHEEVYFVERHPLPEDFLSNLSPLVSFWAGPDPSGHIREQHFELNKLNCPK